MRNAVFVGLITVALAGCGADRSSGPLGPDPVAGPATQAPMLLNDQERGDLNASPPAPRSDDNIPKPDRATTPLGEPQSGTMLAPGHGPGSDLATAQAIIALPHPSATSPASSSGTGSSADLVITEQLQRAVQDDNDLSAVAKRVEITTVNGVVLLRGTVEHVAERRSIGLKATHIAGVLQVDNRLNIVPK